MQDEGTDRIVPVASWPMVIGVPSPKARPASLGSRSIVSEWQRDEDATLISSSLSFGVGTGILLTCILFSAGMYWAAFCVVGSLVAVMVKEVDMNEIIRDNKP